MPMSAIYVMLLALQSAVLSLSINILVITAVFGVFECLFSSNIYMDR